jgi:hypothetical protein
MSLTEKLAEYRAGWYQRVPADRINACLPTARQSSRGISMSCATAASLGRC